MKKLIDLLHEDKYEKVNVKIGSKSGSSFWYCGKGKVEISLPAIKKAREHLLKQSKGTLYQLKYRLEHLDQIYKKTFKEALKKGIKNVESYKKQLNARKEKEEILLPRKIASLEYDCATTLFERPVKEIIEGISPDEKPCWIIYVKGNEKGHYWTIKEYEKRRKKYDTDL